MAPTALATGAGVGVARELGRDHDVGCHYPHASRTGYTRPIYRE